MDVFSKELENGIKVNVLPCRGMQTVGISIGIKYGSVDENPDINGSAHFLEHMMFKGTAKRTWKRRNDEIKSIGANDNAFTDREQTNYIVQAHRSNARKALDIFADMIGGSTIPTDEFELERGPIINENMIHMDNPMYLMDDYVPSLLFKGEPAGMPVGGDNERTIKRITRDALYNIYKEHYVPSNIVISLAGGISAPRGAALVERYMSGFEGSGRAPNRTVSGQANEYRDLVVEKEGISQSKVSVAFRCAPIGGSNIDEYMAMHVVSELLQYRLYEEVREKRGLSYDPQASYTPQNSFAFFAIEAGTEPKNEQKVLDVMMSELKRIEEGEVSAKEVEKMANAVAIRYRMLLDRSMDSAVKITTSTLVHSDPAMLLNMPNIVSKVTLDDVRRFSQKNIQTQRRAMVIMRPKQKQA